MNHTPTRREGLRTGALAVLLGLLAACSGGHAPQWREGGQAKGPQLAAVITAPVSGAKNVPASAEIEFRTENAASASVELKDASGRPVDGELRPGSTTWMPNGQLEYGQTYTATVTVAGAHGGSA
ncbi:MAG TPA: Ig-like domain-containing protein, partial [Pseudonocardiaceae bacterium]|nr:Ig-like domain-containing protein [Pseudonocardiaceae bacterium]